LKLVFASMQNGGSWAAARDRVEVLVLEDNPGDARWLKTELAMEALLDVRLTVASRLSEGMQLLARREFDAVLLDLNLPDSCGMETFECLRTAVPEIPLIVYTGILDDDVGVRALRGGAQDYLVKGPGMGPLLIRAISFAIERHRVRVELDSRADRLEKNRATLRRIIEASPYVVLILDRAGAIRFVNGAAGRLFGLAPAGLMNHPNGLVIPPDAAEMEILCPDGIARTAEVRSVAIEWDGEPASLVSLHDVTERKRLLEQIEAENALLERRVRERTESLQAANAELEAFAHSVSHDLRAPLRHIKGFTEMLAEEAASVLSGPAQTLLRRIVRSTDRMQALIDDLLAFSRLGRGPLWRQQVSLKGLVNDVIEELAPETASRAVEWQVGDLPSIDADPNLMRVVLVNLLANALKFTRGRDPARIEIVLLPDLPGPVIAVRDNGAGFDPTQAERLFGVFQRLHLESEFEGTGIGLATVRRIVSRHGGRVWAEGRPGAGATFFFTMGSVDNATSGTLELGSKDLAFIADKLREESRPETYESEQQLAGAGG
jgi:signal transduction histidine kinase